MDFPIILDSLFPVQAFFNAMSDRSFLTALEGFSRSIGAGFNDAVCEFQNEIESGGEQFSGVKFYIFYEEMVISRTAFVSILEQVCALYLARHPGDHARVTELCHEIKNFVDAGASLLESSQ